MHRIGVKGKSSKQKSDRECVAARPNYSAEPLEDEIPQVSADATASPTVVLRQNSIHSESGVVLARRSVDMVGFSLQQRGVRDDDLGQTMHFSRGSASTKT